jgi:prepilin-type N-terminal cleavage/methylation domain-containing protein
MVRPAKGLCRGLLRPGFTLIELLVVIAIIAVLVGMLLSAVQKVREAANRSKCQNNLKQLGVAVHNFQGTHGCLPTYHGIFPAVNGSTAQSANTKAVHGGWFLHLLPFVEQDALYQKIAGDVSRFGNTGSQVTMPATGTLVTPAQAAFQDFSQAVLVKPAVPATYNDWTSKRVWDPGDPGTTQLVATTTANGYVLYTLQTVGARAAAWVPPQYPDSGTGTPAVYNPGPVTVPARPAVYDPPNSGPVNGFVGAWAPDVRALTYSVLRCGSDPSFGSDPQAFEGQVYIRSGGPWGSTNYLANWNAFTNGDAARGINAPSVNVNNISDGLSNTVMFAEGYAWCEGRGRVALMPWLSGNGLNNGGGVHNFGLTFALSNHQLSINGAAPVTIQASVGYPNPTQEVVFPFQIKPRAKPAGQCGGAECCNSLTVQTGHEVMLVGLADGSVRTVGRSLSVDTWRSVLLPRDGTVPGNDW